MRGHETELMQAANKYLPGFHNLTTCSTTTNLYKIEHMVIILAVKRSARGDSINRRGKQG
jgi:hypothetical protein